MSGSMSLTEVVTKLEAQITYHREREAFHAGEKARHAAEQARHAEQLEQLSQRYEAFTAAVALVEPVLNLPEPSAAAQPRKDAELGDRPKVAQAVVRVLDDWPAATPFGAPEIAAEVNRRFAGKFRRPLTARAVSPFLRRRHRAGVLDCVRVGRPVHGALYRKRTGKA